jgi:hypothetical protein
MANRISKFVLLASCLFLLPGNSSSARAQLLGPAPINNCDEYAARARAQVEMACPHPNDPRWVRDDLAHKKWCLTATPAQRGIEDEARRNGLVQGCRQAASAQNVGNCNEYAWRAEAEIEIASILGQFAPRCRMFGPRWDPDLGAHRVWCNSQPAAAPASEEDHARRIAVATCAVSGQPPSPAPPIK